MHRQLNTELEAALKDNDPDKELDLLRQLAYCQVRTGGLLDRSRTRTGHDHGPCAQRNSRRSERIVGGFLCIIALTTSHELGMFFPVFLAHVIAFGQAGDCAAFQRRSCRFSCHSCKEQKKNSERSRSYLWGQQGNCGPSNERKSKCRGVWSDSSPFG